LLLSLICFPPWANKGRLEHWMVWSPMESLSVCPEWQTMKRCRTTTTTATTPTTRTVLWLAIRCPMGWGLLTFTLDFAVDSEYALTTCFSWVGLITCLVCLCALGNFEKVRFCILAFSVLNNFGGRKAPFLWVRD